MLKTNSELLDLARMGKGIADDSRKTKPGDIFIAVHGARENGADHLEQAIANGAEILAVEESEAKLCQEKGWDYCIWPDTREAVWKLAQAHFGTDTLKLNVIGITGTNGKTTCAALLEHLAIGAESVAGVLGTVNYRWPGHIIEAPLTTPGPLQMHSMLSKMEKAAVNWAIMEVSSHALSQQRVGGINFFGALFTNLTQDHLDYHKDMEDYFQAKCRLFLDLPSIDKKAVINTDDKYGRRLAKSLEKKITFGLDSYPENPDHLQGKILSSGPGGLLLEMRFKDESWKLKSPLVGKYNALNLLGAQAMGIAIGLAPEQFEVLEDFKGVCGRLERIVNSKGYNVFVDYAHTPDALINVQQALKASGFKRLLVVFGCGGNRDRGKRPLMGEAVSKYADIAILTSDNPRLEDPLAIIEDVKPGLSKAKKLYIEPDRKKATELALQLMDEDDALLIAGKGHEDYQIIGSRKIHYSDQETVKELAK